MRTLFLLSLLLVGCSLLFASKPLPDSLDTDLLAISYHQKLPIQFVHRNGESAFELPLGHQPIGIPFQTADYKLFDWYPRRSMQPFRSGVCAVRSDRKTFYWIDMHGDTIMDFGYRYQNVSPIVEGFALGVKKVGGKNRAVFISPTGEEAFDGNLFANAKLFSNGLAAVKDIGEDERWFFLDTTGTAIFTLNLPANARISQIGAFQNGLCLIGTSDKTTYEKDYFFIDRSGTVTIKLKDFGIPLKDAQIFDFTPGYAVIKTYWRDPGDNNKRKARYMIIDRHGEIINLFETNLSDDIHSYYRYHPKWHIFSLEQRTQDSSTIAFFKLDPITGEPMNAQHVEVPAGHQPFNTRLLAPFSAILTTTFEDDRFRSVIDLTTGEMLHTADSQTKLYEDNLSVDDFHLIRSYDGPSRAENNRGETIWTSSPNNTFYHSLEKALPNKDQVGGYNVRSLQVQDFENGLLELENLEHLELNCDSIPPTIGQLTKLKTLEISFSEFHIFPESIGQLPDLEEIKIWKCPNYETGLEAVMENAPSLRKVDISDLSLDISFIMRIKRQRPEVEFIFGRTGGDRSITPRN